MKWVTRARPKVDRVACPRLVRRFIDSKAEFLFVPADEVLAAAEREFPVYDALYAWCGGSATEATGS